jgi:hypothetical protein
VRSDRGRVSLDLPSGISREEAIEINARGQRADGIAAITEKGVAVFTPLVRRVLAQELGMRLCELHPEQAVDIAHDMVRRMHQLQRA